MPSSSCLPVPQALQRHSGGWKQTPPAQRQAQTDQQQTQTQMGRPTTIAGGAPPQPARDDVSESGAIQPAP